MHSSSSCSPSGNTNKPHSFFSLQNTTCTRKPQVISGGGGVRTPCILPLDPFLRQQSRSQKELRGLFLLFYLFVSKVAISPNSPIVLLPYNITFSSVKLLRKHSFQFASLKTRRLDRAAFAMISGSATRDKENQKTRT